MRPDWAALRRSLRPCAIGIVIWTAFLAFWQFAIPGAAASSAPLGFWLLAGALAVLVPTSLVWAVGATRRLWRARRRAAALLPSAVLFITISAFPAFAQAADIGGAITVWSLPAALALSSLVSASYILFTANREEPPSDPGMDGWTKAAERR